MISLTSILLVYRAESPLAKAAVCSFLQKTANLVRQDRALLAKLRQCIPECFVAKPPEGVVVRWRFWVPAAKWCFKVIDLLERLSVCIANHYGIGQLNKDARRIVRAVTDGVTVIAVALVADLGELATDTITFFERDRGLRGANLHEKTDFVWAQLNDARSSLLQLIQPCTAEEIAEGEKLVKAWQTKQHQPMVEAAVAQQTAAQKEARDAAAAAKRDLFEAPRRSARISNPSITRLEAMQEDGAEDDAEDKAMEIAMDASARAPQESATQAIQRLRDVPLLKDPKTNFRAANSSSTGTLAIAPPLALTEKRIAMAASPGLARVVAALLGLSFVQGYAAKLHHKTDKLYRMPFMLLQLGSREHGLALARKVVKRGQAACAKEAAESIGRPPRDVRDAATDAEYSGPFKPLFNAHEWQLLVEFAEQKQNTCLWSHGGELLRLYKQWFAAFPTSSAWVENMLKRVKGLKPQQRWNVETATRQLRLEMKPDELLTPFPPKILV